MDADTRHQLKQNELAEALAKLRDLRDPRFLYTVGAVVVIAIGVLAWYGWRYTQRQSLEQGWQRLEKIAASMSAGDPAVTASAQSDLRTMIRDTSSHWLLGYARLELARSLVETGLLQPTDREANFAEAVKVLTELRTDPDAPPLINAPATFLLATTHESLREFDQAKDLYQALVNDARYAGSPYTTLATERLADIETLAAPVVFVPGDPPPPALASAPATASAPVATAPVATAPATPPSEEPTAPDAPPAEPPPTEPESAPSPAP